MRAQLKGVEVANTTTRINGSTRSRSCRVTNALNIYIHNNKECQGTRNIYELTNEFHHSSIVPINHTIPMDSF